MKIRYEEGVTLSPELQEGISRLEKDFQNDFDGTLVIRNSKEGFYGDFNTQTNEINIFLEKVSNETDLLKNVIPNVEEKNVLHSIFAHELYHANDVHLFSNDEKLTNYFKAKYVNGASAEQVQEMKEDFIESRWNDEKRARNLSIHYLKDKGYDKETIEAHRIINSPLSTEKERYRDASKSYLEILESKLDTFDKEIIPLAIERLEEKNEKKIAPLYEKHEERVMAKPYPVEKENDHKMPVIFRHETSMEPFLPKKEELFGGIERGVSFIHQNMEHDQHWEFRGTEQEKEMINDAMIIYAGNKFSPEVFETMKEEMKGMKQEYPNANIVYTLHDEDFLPKYQIEELKQEGIQVLTTNGKTLDYIKDTASEYHYQKAAESVEKKDMEMAKEHIKNGAYSEKSSFRVMLVENKELFKEFVECNQSQKSAIGKEKKVTTEKKETLKM